MPLETTAEKLARLNRERLAAAQTPPPPAVAPVVTQAPATATTIQSAQAPAVPVDPAFEAQLAASQANLPKPAVNPDLFKNDMPEAPAAAPGPAVMVPVQQTVTETKASPNAAKLQNKLDNITKREGDILTEQAGLAEKEGKATLEALTAQDEELKKLQTERAELTKDVDTQFQIETDRIQKARNELSATPPQDFWARRDTGDKILMALSIFAGAVGQGLGVGRENAAIGAMNQAMARDYQTQAELVNRKLAALDKSSLSLEDKRKAQQGLIDGMKARELATMDQTKRLIERLQLSTKNEGIKAKLDQAKLDLEKNSVEAQQRLDNQTKQVIETRMVSGQSSATGDITPSAEEAAANPDMSSFSPAGVERKPQTLSEKRALSKKMLLVNTSTVKELERIEKNLTPAQFEALQNAARQVNTIEEGKQGLLQTVVGPGASAARQTPAEIYNRALPGGLGARYFLLMNNFVGDQVRWDTGAKIDNSELQRESVNSGITPGIGPENLDLAIQRRRNIMRGHAAFVGTKAPNFGDEGK